jgi:hypothetical protein
VLTNAKVKQLELWINYSKMQLISRGWLNAELYET